MPLEQKITVNISDLGTKRFSCNRTRYLMHLCGVFDGSEIVGKAEFEEVQEKRFLNRSAGKQHLWQVNHRILQLALMMQFPQMREAISDFSIVCTNTLSLQFGLREAMDWLHVCLVISMIAAFVMAAYYRYLWKSLMAANQRWQEIAENLGSQQHQRLMEGLRGYRAYSSRRRRRRLLDVSEGQADEEMMDAHHAEGDQQAEMNGQAQPAGEDGSSSDSSTLPTLWNGRSFGPGSVDEREP